MIKIRGQDCWGAGYYKAPRGKRTHKGIDIISHANQVVVAYEGGTVSRIGFPYSQKSEKKKHFRYVEIATADGCHHRYFYCAPLVDKGDVIERGQTIGSNQTLGLVYPDITQHTHFEVKDGEHKFIDPVPVLEGLGYEIEV